MICNCTCIKGPASSFEKSKLPEGSKSCKSCGGNLVDGLGAKSGSMLSTVGLELSRVIDPHLNWKTATTRKQRAVRKARTSFTKSSRNKSTDKSSKESEDLSSKDSKSTGDMPVSESEKLGVSILGRRFSDNKLGSVPIKKRRCMLPPTRSPSPPTPLSLQSSGSDSMLERQPASYQDTALTLKGHSHDVKSGRRIEFGLGRSSADEKSDLEEVNEKICGTADFSGISILAAAACETYLGGDIVNAEGSVSKRRTSEGKGLLGKSVTSVEKDKLLPNTSEDLANLTDLSLELTASSPIPCKEVKSNKSEESCILEKSASPLQNSPNKTTESSSHDVRFPWDLNTVMDVWDSHDDEILNSEPPNAANVCEDDDRATKPGNVEHCQVQVEYRDAINLSVHGGSKVDMGSEEKGICPLEETKVEEKSGVSGDNSTAGDCESKHCSLPCLDLSAHERTLEITTTGVADISGGTQPLHVKDESLSVCGDLSRLAGGAPVSVGDSSFSSSTVIMEEAKPVVHHVSFSSEMETEISSSHLVSCENASVDLAAGACEQHHVVGQTKVEPFFVENTSVASVADHDRRSTDCCKTDVQMPQPTLVRCSQPASLSTASGIIETDRHSSVSHLAKETSEEQVHGNLYKSMVVPCILSGKNAHVEGLDDANCSNTDKSKETVASAYGDESEETAAEVRVGEDKCYMRASENLDTKTQVPAQIDAGLAHCSPAGMTPSSADAPPTDVALASQGPCKSYTDGYASSSGRVALEDHLDCDYYSDASQNVADQAIGMEKVEFLGDDDSQYEDGELREPITNCWLEDGEEVETERVDYGSDREMDIYEATSDVPAADLHTDNGRLSSASSGFQYRGQAGKGDASSQPFLNRPSTTDVSKTLAVKRSDGSVTEKVLRGTVVVKDGNQQWRRDLKDVSQYDVGNFKVRGDSEFLKQGDSVRDLSHSASSRMKMSGWDQLPRDCRSSGNEVTDSTASSVSRNHEGASLDPSYAGENVKRDIGSSLRRDLTARVERAQSSDGLHRNDRCYARASRSNDRNDYTLRVERETDAPRSIGRSRSSLHLQSRGRGDHWIDHHGSNRHNSSAYFDPDSFTHPDSRNAAAAAVAKVESNGFVVAPDGTIVKAGSVGPTGRLVRRSANASSQSTRRSLMGRGAPIDREKAFGMPLGLGHSRAMSPDRPTFVGRGRGGRYGPGMPSVVHKERYRRHMPDDIVDSSSSMHRPISMRDRSYSPPSHRRSMHLSHSPSISPSRSRTRSPHRWASPRGRNDSGTNCSPGLRRRSRSPNFKSETRLERSRPGFEERVVSYDMPSRNNTSPQHASRWFGGRKDFPDHFREHEYKRCSERSPPARVFSRGQRFDEIDSFGRLKSDYYRPMNSERHPEFVGYGRGTRRDGDGGDRRGYGDKYGMLPPGRQFDDESNVKRFRYDNENGFRSHNSQTKSSEFQLGESPRAFDRGIERQPGHSARRVKEENSHYSHGRGGKHNASFKSFGVQDIDDEMDARRRGP